MPNKDAAGNSSTGSEQLARHDESLLNSAARAIGTAIGKVGSTLHLAQSPPMKPADKPATKKPAANKKRPPARKAVAKKTAPGKKAAAQSRKPAKRSAT